MLSLALLGAFSAHAQTPTLRSGGEREIWREGNHQIGPSWRVEDVVTDGAESSYAVGEIGVGACLGSPRAAGPIVTVPWSGLHRVDFYVKVIQPEGWGEVAIWSWPASATLDRATYLATISQPPLFEDRFPLAPDTGWRRVSVHTGTSSGPLPVAPGDRLFIRITGSGSPFFRLRTALDDSGSSPIVADGAFWRCDEFVENETLVYDLFGPATEGRADPWFAPEDIAPPGPEDWQLPIEVTTPISGETYRARVSDYLARGNFCMSSANQPARPDEWAFDCSLAHRLCELGGEVGCESLALRARDLLEQTCHLCLPTPSAWCRTHFSTTVRPGLAYLWLPPEYRSPTAAEGVVELARRFLVIETPHRPGQQPDDGSWNHASYSALSALLAVKIGCAADSLAPASPAECDRWREIAGDLFTYFYAVVEAQEDAGNYIVNHWLPPMLMFAQVASPEDEIFPADSPLHGRDLESVLWNDARFQALVRRLFDLTLAVGALPNWGNGAGQGGGEPGLIWLFERAAVEFDQPLYRALARRLYRFDVSRAIWDSTNPSHDSYATDFLSLAFASLDASADPMTLETENALLNARMGETTLIHRAEVRRRPRAEWCPTSGVDTPTLCPEAVRAYAFRCDDGQGGDVDCTESPAWPLPSRVMVPDKLMLRGGPGPDDLQVLFSLTSGYQHGYADFGALLTLSAGGAMPLHQTATPYDHFSTAVPGDSLPFDQRDLDRSRMILRRYRGGASPDPEMEHEKPGRRITVPRVVDGAWLEAGELVWRDAMGWGNEFTRRVMLIGNRFLIVFDGVRGPPDRSPIEASVGPIWHLARIADADASGWVDAVQPSPTKERWRYRSPVQHVLVKALGGPDRSVGGYREAAYAPTDVLAHPSCDPLASPIHVGADVDCEVSPPYVFYQRFVGEIDSAAGGGERFATVLVPHPGDDPAGIADAIVSAAPITGTSAIEISIDHPRTGAWTVLDNPREGIAAGVRSETDGDMLVARHYVDGSVDVTVVGGTFATVDGLRMEWEEGRDHEGPLARPCDDGLDNDADGVSDLDDPGCLNGAWWSESPSCSDGVDNDGDGNSDLSDEDCSAPWDDAEVIRVPEPVGRSGSLWGGGALLLWLCRARRRGAVLG